MFKVNNKDTRTTPVAPYFSVSVVKFEHVFAGWVLSLPCKFNKVLLLAKKIYLKTQNKKKLHSYLENEEFKEFIENKITFLSFCI